jgi:hypothetical protein
VRVRPINLERFNELRRRSASGPSPLNKLRSTDDIDVTDDVVVEVKVTSGRHQHATGQLVESATADLDAERAASVGGTSTPISKRRGMSANMPGRPRLRADISVIPVRTKPGSITKTSTSPPASVSATLSVRRRKPALDWRRRFGKTSSRPSSPPSRAAWRGLSTCRSIIDGHGRRLWASVVFQLALPAQSDIASHECTRCRF